jgi:hypothetical protein
MAKNARCMPEDFTVQTWQAVGSKTHRITPNHLQAGLRNRTFGTRPAGDLCRGICLRILWYGIIGDPRQYHRQGLCTAALKAIKKIIL